MGVPYVSNNGFPWAFYLFLSLYILPMQNAVLIIKVPNSQAKEIWKDKLSNGSELIYAKFFANFVHYFIAAALIAVGLLVTFYISPVSEEYFDNALPFLYQIHYFFFIFLMLLFFVPAAFFASLYVQVKNLNEQWNSLIFILVSSAGTLVSILIPYVLPYYLLIILVTLLICSSLLKKLLINSDNI